MCAVRLNESHPHNNGVLTYLSRPRPQAPAIAAPDAIENPYYRCGCHPDIVERLWDRLGAALPADCRCLVYSIPALVHPTSGIVLAIGMGTQYGLRLPAPLCTDAIAAGALTITKWSGGEHTDIRQTLGDDWVFGAWLEGELKWCREAYGMCDRAG